MSFGLFALNNLLLVADLIIFPNRDLWLWRLHGDHSGDPSEVPAAAKLALDGSQFLKKETLTSFNDYSRLRPAASAAAWSQWKSPDTDLLGFDGAF